MTTRRKLNKPIRRWIQINDQGRWVVTFPLNIRAVNRPTLAPAPSILQRGARPEFVL